MKHGTGFACDLRSDNMAPFGKSIKSLFLKRDLSVVSFGVFLRGLAALAFAKLTASLLGPVMYAAYGQLYMVAAYLATGACLGLGNAFTVYVARRESMGADQSADAPAVVAAGTACGFVVAGALMGLFFADRHGALLPKVRGGDLGWWFAFCPVAAAATAIQSVLLGEERHVPYQLLTALNPLVSCVSLAVIAWFIPVSPTVAIVTFMVGFLVPLVAYPGMVADALRVRIGVALDLLRFSKRYLVPSLLIPTIGTISILAVRHAVAINVDTRNLGLWQALWRISEGYMGALISVGTALFLPRFSRIVTRSDATKHLLRGVGILACLYAPLAVSFLVVPKLVLSILLSRQFSPIASLLPVEIIGDFLKIVCFILELFFTCTLRPRLALLGEGLFSALFFGTSFFWADRMHTTFAPVLAYSMSYALVLCFLIPVAVRTIQQLPERENCQAE